METQRKSDTLKHKPDRGERLRRGFRGNRSAPRLENEDECVKEMSRGEKIEE